MLLAVLLKSISELIFVIFNPSLLDFQFESGELFKNKISLPELILLCGLFFSTLIFENIKLVLA